MAVRFGNSFFAGFSSAGIRRQKPRGRDIRPRLGDDIFAAIQFAVSEAAWIVKPTRSSSKVAWATSPAVFVGFSIPKKKPTAVAKKGPSLSTWEQKAQHRPRGRRSQWCMRMLIRRVIELLGEHKAMRTHVRN